MHLRGPQFTLLHHEFALVKSDQLIWGHVHGAEIPKMLCSGIQPARLTRWIGPVEPPLGDALKGLGRHRRQLFALPISHAALQFATTARVIFALDVNVFVQNNFPLVKVNGKVNIYLRMGKGDHVH